MKTIQLISEARTIKQCLVDILRNKNNAYQWYAVKGKNGCLFEIGGRNRESLEIKLYIPKYNENGEPVSLANEYVDSHYSIEENGIFFPSLNCPHKIDVLKMAKLKDFRKWKPTIEIHDYYVQTNSYGIVKNIK